MAEVVLQSPSHFPSSSCAPNDGSHQHSLINSALGQVKGQRRNRKRKEKEREGDPLNLLALLVAAFRKSLIGCSFGGEELCSMDIGVPTNVRHIAHVTFDRFDGFLGLPDEFEPEVPRRAPSASANVFGVSTKSMQLSFDARGNSVPTILLLMQRRLYAQGGLQAEGIFRINAENGQEEYVRDQLNMGTIPDDVDVHCLAGLIKAWFRELPTGILDSLSPEQVIQSQSEEECAELVRQLPPTEAALLDWAVNLMADVAQLEHVNKMNARNIAMVFAPNMTQMADPLTALMYAVQVMNFLKSLIIRTLREREDSVIEPSPASHVEPSDENGHQSPSQPIVGKVHEGHEEEKVFVGEEPVLDSPPAEDKSQNCLTPIENIIPRGIRPPSDSCRLDIVSQVNSLADRCPWEVNFSNVLQEDDVTGPSGRMQTNICKSGPGQSCSLNLKTKKINERPMVWAAVPVEKSKGTSLVGRLNSRMELVEAWR